MVSARAVSALPRESPGRLFAKVSTFPALSSLAPG